MGDRANVLVKNDNNDSGVYLYTHWEGSELPERLRVALQRKLRWNDTQYLTRIVFDAMSEGQQGKESGFGISAFLGDGDDRVLVVNCDAQTVSFKEKTWTFAGYASLSDEEIDGVWR